MGRKGLTCEFCFGPYASFFLMTDPGPSWAACKDCQRLISVEDIKGLEDRAVNAPELSNSSIEWYADIPEPVKRQLVQRIHGRFWEARRSVSA